MLGDVALVNVNQSTQQSPRSAAGRQGQNYVCTTSLNFRPLFPCFQLFHTFSGIRVSFFPIAALVAADVNQSVADVGQGSDRKSSSSSISGDDDTLGHKTMRVSRSSDGVSLSSSSVAEDCSVSNRRSESYPSSLLSRGDTGTATVPGESPLEVKPSLAARRVLRTLRMYVTKLRVTKDNEAKAEE